MNEVRDGFYHDGNAGKGRSLSVLGIDDDQDHLFILETMLRRVDAYQLEVVGHTDHRLALEEIRRRSFDLVIIDYDLKTTLATTLIDTIRSEGFRQPIFVLTGVGNESVAASVMKAGANDYIVKSDVSASLLRVAIDGALGKRRLAEEKAILERELLESQKMEAIGTLIGGLAFDFNNLLTVVLGEAEMALTKSAGSGVERHIQTIQQNAFSMASIVRKLVAFDRTERETPSPGYLGMVVSDTCAYLHHILPRTIRIESEITPLGDRVNIHERSIRQILINLALNSADAMPSGGTIGIRVYSERGGSGWGPLPDHLRRGSAVLEVSDTGKGMNAEVRQRMFEPFFTTKEFSSRKGAGLGLSMVWQLVKSMQGHTQVSSEPNQGTTIRILLPFESISSQAKSGDMAS
ncbi:MAG: response regulator [Candidatus Hydrogenedentes bacterium]|nr:response regulator [Candidatus Hydrogenedentota bacterium]